MPGRIGFYLEQSGEGGLWLRCVLIPILFFSIGNFAFQGLKALLGFEHDLEFALAVSFHQALILVAVIAFQRVEGIRGPRSAS